MRARGACRSWLDGKATSGRPAREMVRQTNLLGTERGPRTRAHRTPAKTGVTTLRVKTEGANLEERSGELGCHRPGCPRRVVGAPRWAARGPPANGNPRVQPGSRADHVRSVPQSDYTFARCPPSLTAVPPNSPRLPDGGPWARRQLPTITAGAEAEGACLGDLCVAATPRTAANLSRTGVQPRRAR